MYFLHQKKPSLKDWGVLFVHLDRCGELAELHQVLWGLTDHLIVIDHLHLVMLHLLVEDLANLLG